MDDLKGKSESERGVGIKKKKKKRRVVFFASPNVVLSGCTRVNDLYGLSAQLVWKGDRKRERERERGGRGKRGRGVVVDFINCASNTVLFAVRIPTSSPSDIWKLVTKRARVDLGTGSID